MPTWWRCTATRRLQLRQEGGVHAQVRRRLRRCWSTTRTSLVFNDPPLHTRVRKLIMGALTRRAIADMEPGLVQLVDGLLDAIEAKGGGDLWRTSPRRSRWRSSATCWACRMRPRRRCAAGRWRSWVRWSPS
jgi:hypothetical protein